MVLLPIEVDMGPTIFFVVIAFVVAIIVFAAYAQHKRRTEIGAGLAAAGFACELSPQMDAKVAAFDAAGVLKKLRNGAGAIKWLAHGTLDETPLHIFEHSYTTGAGKSRQVHNNTVVSIRCPAAWPELTLAPENFFHRIGEMFGAKDLKVEDENFNKRWRVKASNEDFAILVLSPEVQAWSMNLPTTTRIYIGAGALIVNHPAQLNAKQVAASMRHAVELWKLIPPEVREWRA